MKYRAAAGSWSFPAAANSHPLIFFTKMDIPTVPGSLYTVATKTTCDITDTATGTPIDSVSSGSVTFAAQGAVTTLSDPEATYSKVNFKNAAAALRMLGGGDQLPNGYLEAEFIGFSRNGYFDTLIPANNETGMRAVISQTQLNDYIFAGARGNGDSRFYASRSRAGGYVAAYGWNRWLYFEKDLNAATDWYTSELNFKNSRVAKIEYNGTSSTMPLNEELSENGYNIFIGGANVSNSPQLFWHGCCKEMQITQGQDIVRSFIPVLANGVPSFFDKISKMLFENKTANSLYIGLTLVQARKLGALPAGGGTLKISLPENYTDDEAVGEALSTATENDWVLTIQTYSEAAASSASTFSLRRIWVKKTASPAGAYVDANGERWHVEWCQTVLGAEPTDLGYEPFRSVDVAMAEWELTPYVYPEEETLSI